MCPRHRNSLAYQINADIVNSLDQGDGVLLEVLDLSNALDAILKSCTELTLGGPTELVYFTRK